MLFFFKSIFNTILICFKYRVMKYIIKTHLIYLLESHKHTQSKLSRPYTLMPLYLRISVEGALAVVRGARPAVQPNPGFMARLKSQAHAIRLYTSSPLKAL